MNIFFLGDGPYLCANSLDDKRTFTMAKEMAQMLSTAHHLANGWEKKGDTLENVRYVADYDLNTLEVVKALNPNAQFMMRPTHVNHPSTMWICYSAANYNFGYTLLECALERFMRYQAVSPDAKTKLHYVLETLEKTPANFPRFNSCSTPVPLCMPDEYKVKSLKYVDRMHAYRRMWVHTKSPVYVKTPAPKWYENWTEERRK